MSQLEYLAGSLLLGIGLMSGQSQASLIRSMTIEEIGAASGGLGTSAVSNVGGEFFVANVPADSGFVSAGSHDGAIVMGYTQTPNAFTPGFTFFGTPAFPHTMSGAPTGHITGGAMTLDLSGWRTLWSGIDFALFPDAGTLLTSVSRLDASRYYYTADWSHVITAAENGAFASFPVNWHLEGIATVPEPGTHWLLGVSALGLIGARRPKKRTSD